MDIKETVQDNIHTEITEYDVVEMDFPEYTEEFPPIGGIAAGTSFSAKKMEIYRRNREIAAEMQSEVLAEKEQAKADKIAELEKIYDESEAVTKFAPKLNRRIFTLMTVICAVVISVMLGISFRSSVEFSKSQAAAESAAEAAATMVIAETEAVTRAETTRVTRAETEMVVTEEVIEEITEEATEIPVEILKTTAVREPFEESGTALVYNTEAMSYRFEPKYTPNQYDQLRLTINVTIKNLTDYDYAVVPNFFMTLGESQIYTYRNSDEQRASTYDYSTRSKYLKTEELEGGEWVESGHEFSAYDFDENHLFSLTLDFDAREIGVFENFKYDPQYRINSEYSERVDEGFEIPFEEFKKYIIVDFPEE